MNKKISLIGVSIILATLCFHILASFISFLTLTVSYKTEVELPSLLINLLYFLEQFQTIITTLFLILGIIILVYCYTVKLIKSNYLNKIYRITIGTIFASISGLALLLAFISIFNYTPVLYPFIYSLSIISIIIVSINCILEFINSSNNNYISFLLSSLATIFMLIGIVVTFIFSNFNTDLINSLQSLKEENPNYEDYVSLETESPIYTNKGYILGGSTISLEYFKYLLDNPRYEPTEEVNRFCNSNPINVVILTIGTTFVLLSICFKKEEEVQEIQYLTLPKNLFKRNEDNLAKLELYHNHLLAGTISEEDYNKYRELLLK